jgi:hypothetical protein
MGNFGANKGNTEEKKNKKQLLIEAKARVERDQKFLEEYKSSKMKRLNQVGLLVPSADHRDGSETVFSGPQWKHRHCNHIFVCGEMRLLAVTGIRGSRGAFCRDKGCGQSPRYWILALQEIR